MQMRNTLNDDEQNQKLEASNSIQLRQVNKNVEKLTAFKVIMMCFLLFVLIASLVVLYNNNLSFKNSKDTASKLLFKQIASTQKKQKEQLDKKKTNNKQLSYLQQKHQLQNNNTIVDQKFFKIPKILWVYSDGFEKQTIFVKKCYANMQHYANQSGYNISVINEQNYKNWITVKNQQKIASLLSALQKMDQKQMKKSYKSIKQQLISYYILHQKGGILIDSNIILTQNFTWIQSINNNPYLNRGNHNTIPKYFTFYEIDHGSPMLPLNKVHSPHQYEHYMIMQPGIQTYFMAAIPQGEYLQRVLQQFCKILKNKLYLSKVINTFNLHMGTLTSKDIFTKGIIIASHIVLHIKQFQISKKFRERSTVQEFAIDYYGLMTINCRYFPKKVNRIFDHIFQEKIYQNLVAYTLEELEQTVGPLRYIVKLQFQQEINNRLKQLINKNSQNKLIHPHSFIAKYFFLNIQKEQKGQYFMKQIQKSITNLTAPKWQSLPKILWLFWTSGFKKTSSGNKICIQNLIRSANKSGFQVREINNTNVEFYIGKEMNQKFDNIIKNHKIPVFPPTKSNLIRKAIIARYGGIYLDVSYISLESFDWILNIAQYPSQYIFNRYGQLPKILFFFHPHYGQPFSWKYNPKANTKNMQLVAYQNNLIIAQPNHQLLKQWIDEYARVITSPYQQTKKRMEEYHVKGHSWTNDNDLYLTSMDSLKNVIGRRQNQLNMKAKANNYDGPRSAAQYYGIWSLSGYRGQQKIRINTNFDNSYYSNPQSSNNVFLYRYSIQYTQGILGKANQLIKLYNWSLRHLTELIEQEYEYNFTRKINPNSYCMKYLIKPLQDKIIKRVEQIHINDQ